MMLREMDNRDLLILLESEHHLSDKVGAALRDVNKSFRFVRSIFFIYLSLTRCELQLRLQSRHANALILLPGRLSVSQCSLYGVQ